MSFDPIVSNAGRLSILTALAVQEQQEFVHLRSATQLTDGNLASHGRRLRAAGLIAIDKRFRDGKPVTRFTLTATGRTALESHVRRLMAALSQRRTLPAPGPLPSHDHPPVEPVPEPEEDWVD
jgi:DNA-binding MarR family transcriptional regulator